MKRILIVILLVRFVVLISAQSLMLQYNQYDEKSNLLEVESVLYTSSYKVCVPIDSIIVQNPSDYKTDSKIERVVYANNIPRKYNLSFNSFIDFVDSSVVRYLINPEDFISKPEMIPYYDSIPDFQWEIKDSTRVIDGKNIFLATTEYRCQKYEAWFCPEVPIPAGPAIFGGLPGLIFEIVMPDKNYALMWKLVKYSDVSQTSQVIPDRMDYRRQFQNLSLDNFCSRKEVFEKYKEKLSRLLGAKDCKQCDSKLKDIQLYECFDSCH